MLILRWFWIIRIVILIRIGARMREDHNNIMIIMSSMMIQNLRSCKMKMLNVPRS